MFKKKKKKKKRVVDVSFCFGEECCWIGGIVGERGRRGKKSVFCCFNYWAVVVMLCYCVVLCGSVWCGVVLCCVVLCVVLLWCVFVREAG